MDVLGGAIDLVVIGIATKLKPTHPIIERSHEDSMSYLDRGSFRYINDTESDLNCSVYTSTDVRNIGTRLGSTRNLGKKKSSYKEFVKILHKMNWVILFMLMLKHLMKL